MTLFTFAKHLAVSGVILLAAAAGWSEPLPFEPGEKLFYEVRWERIPVAQVSLEVRPFKQLQGAQAFHFVFRARTYPAVDILYPVEGRMESFADMALTRSLRFAKDMQEGRSQRIYRVDFDWTRGMATYENGEHKQRRIPLPEGTLDMIAMLYYARSLPLEAGLEVARPLSSGKKTLLAQARVVRRETIMVDGRAWPAFLIEPDISKAGGVFEKSKEAELYLWISADDRQIPLKVVSKVWVGAFIVELISAPPEPVTAGF
jgi:hypothetical protein